MFSIFLLKMVNHSPNPLGPVPNSIKSVVYTLARGLECRHQTWEALKSLLLMLDHSAQLFHMTLKKLSTTLHQRLQVLDLPVQALNLQPCCKGGCEVPDVRVLWWDTLALFFVGAQSNSGKRASIHCALV